MKMIANPGIESPEFDKRLWQAMCFISSGARIHFASPSDVIWSETHYRANCSAALHLYRGLYSHVCNAQATKGPGSEEVEFFSPSTVGARLPTEEFIDTLYEFQDRGDIRGGIRHVFSRMNSWLMDGHFQICNAILRDIDVSRLGVDLVLSLLTITRAARHELPNRATYLECARQRITAIRGSTVAKRLLENMAG